MAKVKSPKYVACTTLVEYNGPFDLHIGEHVDEKDIVDIIRTGRTADLLNYLKKGGKEEEMKEIQEQKKKFDAMCQEIQDVERCLAPVWHSQRDFGRIANNYWF